MHFESIVREPALAYKKLDDSSVLSFSHIVRDGIAFSEFELVGDNVDLSISEWAEVLHLSERTLIRYKKDKKRFGNLESDRILQVILLYGKGIDVFGSSEKFNSWMRTVCSALDEIVPVSLLISSYGIQLLKDELTRIEYGVLA